ncbi:MAG: Na+/H+ antiporter NhaC family protein [Faecalibacterium prausnitzii]
MLVVSIAACLSGAVCGDHCSPISDTTIMASAGAHCSHVNHVSTQLPYAITRRLLLRQCAMCIYGHCTGCSRRSASTVHLR